MVRERLYSEFYYWGWLAEVSILLSQLIFIIPTCIVVPATKNDIKVVLDQENVQSPCCRETSMEFFLKIF